MSKQDKPVAGWKLVPLEPTPQMLSAILKEFNRANSLHDAMKMERLPLTDREIYCAMIAAAPPPAARGPVLTDEQIDNLARQFWPEPGNSLPMLRAFARDVLAAARGSKT